jgi:hypothetical protein
MTHASSRAGSVRAAEELAALYKERGDWKYGGPES